MIKGEKIEKGAKNKKSGRSGKVKTRGMEQIAITDFF